jgi:hypothetical protein
VRRRLILLALPVVVPMLLSCSSASTGQPVCDRPDGSIFVLEAQAVPSSTRLPCIAELPIGWRFGGSFVEGGSAKLWLDHDRAGIHAVEITMTASCDTQDAVEIPPASDEIGMQVYELPTALSPAFTGSRFMRFRGGCIQYRYGFTSGAEPTLTIEAEQAISTITRAQVVSNVQDELELPLCGADAPPCPG